MIGNLREALRLLLVTDDRLVAGRDLLDACRAAIGGGATAVQLRLKKPGDRELLQLARAMVASLEVPVFVNDRMDIALAAGAAGVHLGPDDLPVAAARRAAPPGFIIGASVGSAAEVAGGRDADYWGVGPLRSTTTKSDAGAGLGREGAAAVLALARQRPCVLIGGVVPADVAAALADGFAGVAVAGGILATDDIAAAAAGYR